MLPRTVNLWCTQSKPSATCTYLGDTSSFFKLVKRTLVQYVLYTVHAHPNCTVAVCLQVCAYSLMKYTSHAYELAVGLVMFELINVFVHVMFGCIMYILVLLSTSCRTMGGALPNEKVWNVGMFWESMGIIEYHVINACFIYACMCMYIFSYTFVIHSFWVLESRQLLAE